MKCVDEIIRSEHVYQAFPVSGGEDFYALKDINITIPEGKLTILRGRSGSGKTTLMNILGALDKPKKGNVYFQGKKIESLEEGASEKLRKQEIGFVFQSVALIPMMTAYENVEFALRLAGVKGDHKKRVEKCLHLVGLGQRMDHLPQEMSGGEQQRVAIARAIVHKPKVVFADEPTAELDTGTAVSVMKLFKELIEHEGVTIVMTTHDVGLMDAADCIYELEDGEVINGTEE